MIDDGWSSLHMLLEIHAGKHPTQAEKRNQQRPKWHANLQFPEFSLQSVPEKRNGQALEELTFGRETEAEGWSSSRLLWLGYEDVEQAHDARVLPDAAVVGHDRQHLAVADLDGSWLRVARRHADDVVRLVPCLLPRAIGRKRFA